MLGDNGLYGNYKVKIDAKNRVIIPAPFAPDVNDKVYVVYCDEEFIRIYPKEEYEKMMRTLAEKDDVEGLMVYSNAHLSRIDKQHRCILPQEFISKIFAEGEAREVEILGFHQYMAVWNRVVYQEAREKAALTRTRSLESYE